MNGVGTTARTGWLLDLRGSRFRHAGVRMWGLREDAMRALAALRERGRNADRGIQACRARDHLTLGWVLALPDHHEVSTALMRDDGSWVVGRLVDSPCFCTPACRAHPTPWRELGRPPAPATVTHDYRYSAGSVGVIGHDGRPLMSGGWLDAPPVEVLSWMASAWCVACTWSTHGDDEGSVRAHARFHRANPHLYADHVVPRRP